MKDSNHIQSTMDVLTMEALVDGQSKVLEMISSNKPLDEILNTITLWVEQQSGNRLLASVLLLDEDGKKLINGASPSLPKDYNDGIAGLAIGPCVGCCGTAAFTRETVVSEDIERDPLWQDYKDLALMHGLRSCWATPLISSSGALLGTFAIYYKELRKPSDEEHNLVKMVGRTAVLAIEHAKIEEERNKLVEQEKKAHAQTSAEKNRFFELLLNTPAIVGVFSGPNHIVELANDLFMESAGVNRDIIGKPLAEALPELVEQGFVDLLDNVYKTGEPYFGFEVPVKLNRKTANTEEHAFYNFFYKPVRNEKKEITGVFIHATDVTEFINARKRVEESEERFRTLADQSPIFVWMSDKNSDVTYVNKELAKYINLSIEDALGATWRNLIHPDDLHIMDEIYKKSQVDPKPFSVESRFRKADSEDYRWFLFKGVPRVTANGEFDGFNGTAIDIDEEKSQKAQLEKHVKDRTEELIEANEKLERSNNELEQFAYVASHDLQEPLRKIKAFGDIIVGKYKEKLGEDGANMIGRMQSAADRMGSLIESLLAFSRVSRNVDKAQLDLNKILQDVLTDMETTISDKKANIKADKLLSITGSEHQMRQLFQNLIGNAIKFSKPDVPPEITITAKEVLGKETDFHLTGDEGDKKFQLIEVSDNGIGFDQQYGEKIFLAFQRLHGKDEYPGTGLGLSIVYKVVDNHDGYIKAIGKPGEGAVFQILLPLDQ